VAIGSPPSATNTGYIRRNAMNQAQIERGWWHGGPNRPKTAYYSFTFRSPQGSHNLR
jgi:hypothetical protein